MGQMYFKAKFKLKGCAPTELKFIKWFTSLTAKWIFKTLGRMAFELNWTCSDHFRNLSSNSLEDTLIT